MGYYFGLAARVLLYAPSHRQDSTCHSLCYTSRGALAGTRKYIKYFYNKKKSKKPVPILLYLTKTYVNKISKQEGNVLFNKTLTFFLYGYMALDIW